MNRDVFNKLEELGFFSSNFGHFVKESGLSSLYNAALASYLRTSFGLGYDSFFMKLLLSQIDLDFFHDVGTSEDEYEKYQRYYKHKIKEMKDEIPILVRWFYSRRSHVDNCIGVHRRVNFKEMKELVDFINNQVPGISLGFLLDDFAGDIQTQPKDKPNNMEKQEKATQIKTSHEGE